MTGIEAYADMYVLTNQTRYLAAVMGAWDMWVRYFKHLGGSAAINEAMYYYPGSYYLTFQTPTFVHPRFASHAAHVEHPTAVAAQEGGTRSKIPPPPKTEGVDASSCPPPDATGLPADHPTGEFCGAVFWAKLNQRLHRLYPENETYVAMIEEVVFNEAPAHMEFNSSRLHGLNAIRYFSNLNGVKEDGDQQGTVRCLPDCLVVLSFVLVFCIFRLFFLLLLLLEGGGGVLKYVSSASNARSAARARGLACMAL